MTKYLLLKDLPITLAGTIFIQKESNSSVYKPKNGGWLEEVPEELVTGCPDWFAPVEEVHDTMVVKKDYWKRVHDDLRFLEAQTCVLMVSTSD